SEYLCGRVDGLDDCVGMLRHPDQRGHSTAPILVLAGFVPQFPILDSPGGVICEGPDVIVPILHVERRITGSGIVIALRDWVLASPGRRTAKRVKYVHPMGLSEGQPAIQCGPVV